MVADKTEWESFLAAHKKLELGYELLLRKIEASQARSVAQEEFLKAQILKSESTLNQIRRSLDRMTEETERELDAIE